MTPHPHKALINAITSGAAAELISPHSHTWIKAQSADLAMHHGATYGWENVRLKPIDTHREKTVRYPTPMQVMPEKETEYWLLNANGVVRTTWLGMNESGFNAGLCYEIHREAEAKEAWAARFGEGWK